jgi:hypothetical protein
MTTKKTPGINFLGTIAVVVVLIGAIISAILTINAGHKNVSVILPALFLIWVLSPFIMLLVTNSKIKRYPDNGRIIQYILMIFLSLSSVIGYTGILSPVGAKAAAVFLIVPLISWVLIIIFIIIRNKSKVKQL